MAVLYASEGGATHARHRLIITFDRELRLLYWLCNFDSERNGA